MIFSPEKVDFRNNITHIARLYNIGKCICYRILLPRIKHFIYFRQIIPISLHILRRIIYNKENISINRTLCSVLTHLFIYQAQYPHFVRLQ